MGPATRPDGICSPFGSGAVSKMAMIATGGDVGEALLAILMAPGTMAIVLGLEMLERRLLGSRSADNGRGPDS
jgi:hypothetical protein